MPGNGVIATPLRLAAALGGHLPGPNAAIGLLGGSFNPPHRAHRDISLQALQHLGLDEVWWLVSPQNPLKAVDGMAPLAERLRLARLMVNHPRLRPSALEALLGTRRTADSLAALKQRFPAVRFVWLMGADNMVQVEKWHQWEQIFNSVPVAIFDRPSYSLRAMAAKPAKRFAHKRLKEASSRRLVDCGAPAWVFIHGRQNPLSATNIRAEQLTAPR
jgi:nicotinate-nucleotide adenylyltransferase